MAGLPTQSAHFDSISGPEGALKLSFPLAVSPALAVLENGANAAILAILATQDVELQAGGSVFDNTATDYSARVADSRDVFNAGLSGNTALEAMLGVLKASPRAKATASLSKLAATTGKINVPTVFMTGVADPITPAGATQRILDKYSVQFEAEKEAAKKASYNGGIYTPAKSKVLALWSVTPKSWTKFDAAGAPITSAAAAPGTNHCNFTAANYVTAAKFMVEGATNGSITWNASAMAAVRKSKGLLVDPNFRAPLLKFYGE